MLHMSLIGKRGGGAFSYMGLAAREGAGLSVSWV